MRGGAGLLCGSVGVCCASCDKVMNVGQWTDGDSWFVTQGTTGGPRSWHRAQGRDRRESPSLWLRKAVPDWRLPLCQGGGQAWAHRPLWYLSATWQALNMSCYCLVPPPSQFVRGNSVSISRVGKLRPWERPCSVVSACTYTVHTSSPLSPEWSETKTVMITSIRIIGWSKCRKLEIDQFSPLFFLPLLFS